MSIVPPQSEQTSETPPDKQWPQIYTLPVLVFQINAWKAKRWGVLLEGIGGVDSIFSQNAEHSLAITIKELLAYYTLSAADIINIVNNEPPPGRSDTGSMEVWIYVRNPHYDPKATL